MKVQSMNPYVVYGNENYFLIKYVKKHQQTTAVLVTLRMLYTIVKTENSLGIFIFFPCLANLFRSPCICTRLHLHDYYINSLKKIDHLAFFGILQKT